MTTTTARTTRKQRLEKGRRYAHWLKAFSECLYDDRPVTIIQRYREEVQSKFYL
jgi:hypothetical protein